MNWVCKRTGTECACGCGVPFEKGDEGVMLATNTQKNGVFFHRDCIDKAFEIGSEVWGKWVVKVHTNEDNSTNCGGVDYGFHFTAETETLENAIDLGLRGFTTWKNNGKYYGHMYRKNAQQASRIAKALSKEEAITAIKVNGNEANTAEKFHDAMRQVVQNYEEKWKVQ